MGPSDSARRARRVVYGPDICFVMRRIASSHVPAILLQGGGCRPTNSDVAVRQRLVQGGNHPFDRAAEGMPRGQDGHVVDVFGCVEKTYCVAGCPGGESPYGSILVDQG